jgi:DNA-binding PadR family transcriptional regulator
MHGYEMIQELDARTSGMWHPSPGSVYPTLQMFEEQGFVVGQDIEGRKLFSLTEEGQAEAERLRTTRAPWEHFADGIDPHAVDLRDVGFGVLAAAKQVLHHGTDAQKTQALEVLTETRRRLYAILAEEQQA